jgi:hypothetical protein
VLIALDVQERATILGVLVEPSRRDPLRSFAAV